MERIYEAHEKVLMVEALNAAKQTLWLGSGGKAWWESNPDAGTPAMSESICGSLPKTPGGDLVRDVIMSRLDGYFGVRSWLVGNGHLPNSEKFGAHRRVQAFRSDWIDALIVEFSA